VTPRASACFWETFQVDQGREQPRPPRRVPSGAAPLGDSTVIQSRTATQRPRPVRRPPRPWYLIPVVLAVLAGGVVSAFVAREQYGAVDPAEAQQEVGPGVVTVLATSCKGTGRATGLLIGGGKVITVASAIREPAAVAIVTEDGVVRRAQVMGVGDDGVAVLRQQGAQLAAPVPELAEDPPKAGAELAVIGRGESGAPQASGVSLAAGSISRLATAVNARSLGAPVTDSRNRVVGLVTASDAGGTTLAGVAAIRAYAGADPPLTQEPGGTCTYAKGPQDAVLPVLEGALNERSEAALKTLARYISAVNRHDFAGIIDTYTGTLLKQASPEFVRKQHRTTYLFGPRLSEVLPYGKGLRARMIFTTIHYLDGPAKGMMCARWDLVYTLEPDDGVMKIAGLTEATQEQSCDIP
jgi:hypothetical protein